MQRAGRPEESGPEVGQRLGQYELLSLLGEGATGVVFRACRDPGGESVAVKVLRDELAEDALYRGRFQREARIASEVTHEHIVPVVDFGEASGRLYIVSQYVQGVPVLTKTGAVAGTVDYLAPELIRGHPASPASDVYALGCLVYECLTGAPPFAGRSYVDTLIAHIREEPSNPDIADLPETVSPAVVTALAKEPAERPTASAYARLLRASAQAA